MNIEISHTWAATPVTSLVKAYDQYPWQNTPPKVDRTERIINQSRIGLRPNLEIYCIINGSIIS